MEDLPIEVWFCVTEHLDDEELQALIGVNRFFYNLGMDARYEELTIDTSSQDIDHYLDHLMTPQVAKRVKKLAIHLRPLPLSVTRRPPSPSLGKKFVSRIRTAVRKVIPDRASPATAPLSICPSDLAPHDLATIQNLTSVLSRMVNIEDYRIVTWVFPSSKSEYLSSLYKVAWDTFGDNLLRVSFCAHLDGHKALMDTNPRLAKLETLELEFSDNMASPHDPEEDTTALVGKVVPFVNKLSPQVKTLKIRSWGRLDLSHFFLNLHGFPSLDSALIRIPFNHSLRTDASGLARLLCESSTMTSIALRLTPVGLALDPNREAVLCEWLQDLLSDPRCFSSAKEIDICPTHLPGGTDILRLCIEHSAQHLTTFKLRDRYLTSEETLALVPQLQPATYLTRLRLNVLKLNVPMFDAFAKNLLALRFLWLSVGDVDAGSSNAPGVFREGIKTRRYEEWNLWDLSIWQGGSELDGETMIAISQSIPSLRSFWETGYKHLTC